MTGSRAVTAATGALRAWGVRRHRDDPDHWLSVARTVMRSVRYSVMVTVAADGPHAATVEHFGPSRELVLHVGTSPATRKARQVAADERVSMVFQRPHDRACVVARCTATILSDEASRHRWFMPAWRSFWPDGPDHDFVVVRCVPYRLEVWDLRRRVTPPPFGLASAHLVRDGERWIPSPD